MVSSLEKIHGSRATWLLAGVVFFLLSLGKKYTPIQNQMAAKCSPPVDLSNLMLELAYDVFDLHLLRR